MGEGRKGEFAFRSMRDSKIFFPREGTIDWVTNGRTETKPRGTRMMIQHDNITFVLKT